ncbi:hypothetical protein [Enterococcus sp. AZ107]|uniref:hypothetical protein n=1 Tax=unclassified Enterococcus TaxID=2608891 RepID=UPI003F2079FE
MFKKYEVADKRSARIAPELVNVRKKEWEQNIMKKYGTGLKRAKLLYAIDRALGKVK